MHNQKENIDRKDGTVEDNTSCGFWCFKPRWIQQYATPRVYLILFSVIGVIQACYYRYFVSIISTLEKRYAFETKISTIPLIANEITPLLLGVITGYIGGRTHRPRMVAFGMFAGAACCFVSALPYLIYGSAKHLSFIKYENVTGPEFCKIEKMSGHCDTDGAPPTLAVVGIFSLGGFFKGFSTLTYNVIGVSYMDDNVKKKNSPLYLAIAMSVRWLGPLFGFLMSSAFLKLYEDPTHDPGYGPDDPRWIGAWWMGFFLQAVLLAIFTIPIALFPRRLPGPERVEKNEEPVKKVDLNHLFLGFVSAMKRLAKNPVFILMVLNNTTKIFGHFGFSIMLPKYMENQFRLSAAEASLYSGAFPMAVRILSTILGGYITWIFKPRIKVLLVGMIASQAIFCAGMLILIFPRCQIVDMANFGIKDGEFLLNSTCNQMCDCSTSSYTPFCGPGGITYFSPCYAGCTQEMISSSSNNSKEFGNCSCIAISADEHLISTISEGFCPDETCWFQVLQYLIIYYILVMTSHVFTVVHTMIMLRCVQPDDKCVALGTAEALVCVFAFIPFPITFAALVDSACLIWENNCGETGNCWFYDMEKYSYLLHGVTSFICFIRLLCLTGIYFLRARIRDMYAD